MNQEADQMLKKLIEEDCFIFFIIKPEIDFSITLPLFVRICFRIISIEKPIPTKEYKGCDIFEIMNKIKDEIYIKNKKDISVGFVKKFMQPEKHNLKSKDIRDFFDYYIKNMIHINEHGYPIQ